jgi:hypothetical protein
MPNMLNTFVKEAEYLDQLGNYRHLKKESASWNSTFKSYQHASLREK